MTLEQVYMVVVIAAILLLATLASVVLYYLIRVLRDVADVTDRVSHGARLFQSDMRTLRENIRRLEIGATILSLLRLTRYFSRKKKNS